MAEPTPTSLLILGRQPELGLAELESLYGPKLVRKIGTSAAELAVEATDVDFERLGGTIKLARLLATIDESNWASLEKYLIDEIPNQLEHLLPGKFTLGMSVYGMDLSPKALSQSLMKIKTAIRETGRPVRIVPNNSIALSSAQVIHNQLTGSRGWELILIRDGQKTLVAQTLKIQDIAAYAKRDQARPKRDARVGMLPPKLAQIIVNLTNPPTGASVVDPFCGTGVILQESLLMNYDVIGTDIDERMVDFARENLSWLRAMRPQIGSSSHVEVGDATTHTWPSPIGAVASEAYLGRPLSALPAEAEMDKIVRDVNTILTKFLKNLSNQLELGTKICLAVPAWHTGQNFIKLPLIAKITDMGYNFRQFQHVDATNLIYYRAGQVVGRQLLVLEKI